MVGWYVCSGGSAAVGPVSMDFLCRGVRAGRVPLTSMVCPVGGTQWIPLVHLPELAPAIADLGQPAPTGDEDLLEGLFEAMHELHLCRDGIEGAAYCLRAGVRHLAAEAAMVHVFDVDRREFFVSNAAGALAAQWLQMRHPEDDPILSRVRLEAATLVIDEARSFLANLDRYRPLLSATSIVAAPLAPGGIFVGAIEFLNPCRASEIAGPCRCVRRAATGEIHRVTWHQQAGVSAAPGALSRWIRAGAQDGRRRPAREAPRRAQTRRRPPP